MHTVSCARQVYLFEQKYSKNDDTVKYYYNSR